MVQLKEDFFCLLLLLFFASFCFKGRGYHKFNCPDLRILQIALTASLPTFKDQSMKQHIFLVSLCNIISRPGLDCGWLRTSSCPCQDTSTYWWSNLRPNTFCIYSEQKHPSEESPKNKIQAVLTPGSPWALPLVQPRLPLQSVSVWASISWAKSSPELSSTIFYLFAYLCPISLAGQRKSWALESKGDKLCFGISVSCPITASSSAGLDHSFRPTVLFWLPFDTPN